ncbi:MAG: KTSC domain-containing protein [Burkholderiaceae bacterium]
MSRQMLRTDKLRSAAYDAAASRLEIEFNNGDLLVYKGVPQEVARRFLAAPNPQTFWEDRIAEEYPCERASGARNEQARASLDALFASPSPAPSTKTTKRKET